MMYPRITAVIFVILLIGSLSILCIAAITLHDPIYSHASNVEQVEGKIVSIEAGGVGGAEGGSMNFVLETASGQHLHFYCGDQCHGSLKHLQRHLYEQAATYVYYVEGADKSLMALTVD